MLTAGMTKGYLFIQTVKDYDKESLQHEYDADPDPTLSYQSQGWLPITHCIKTGEFLKLSAEREGVKVEARVNIANNVKGGNNGSCEVLGGVFRGEGIFRNVRRETHPEFRDFFVCHSVSPKSGLFLRWQIGVNDFLDADTVSDAEEPA